MGKILGVNQTKNGHNTFNSQLIPAAEKSDRFNPIHHNKAQEFSQPLFARKTCAPK